MKQRYALISTHDKSDLKKICAILAKYQIKIISTGATAKFIQSLGFECKKISNFWIAPAILIYLMNLM